MTDQLVTDEDVDRALTVFEAWVAPDGVDWTTWNGHDCNRAAIKDALRDLAPTMRDRATTAARAACAAQVRAFAHDLADSGDRSGLTPLGIAVALSAMVNSWGPTAPVSPPVTLR